MCDLFGVGRTGFDRRFTLAGTVGRPEAPGLNPIGFRGRDVPAVAGALELGDGLPPALDESFGDVVLADAILKNISGFDYNLAWQALKKDAFQVLAIGFEKEGRLQRSMDQ